MTTKYKLIQAYEGMTGNVGDVYEKYVFPKTGIYCYVRNVKHIVGGLPYDFVTGHHLVEAQIIDNPRSFIEIK